MDDKPPSKCSICGGRLEKMTSAPAIQFKGSGWYVTDYADNGKKAAAKADTEAGSSTSSTTDDKKPDKKSKETSPSKKTSDKTSTTKSKAD
jgi:predicted nucleic acid-binding Zn ribbon protein